MQYPDKAHSEIMVEADVQTLNTRAYMTQIEQIQPANKDNVLLKVIQ